MSCFNSIVNGACAAAWPAQHTPRPRVRRPALVRQDSPDASAV
ncbi:hypothetical protein ACFV5N_13185 [Streptomyces sp. NPDC059853]